MSVYNFDISDFTDGFERKQIFEEIQDSGISKQILSVTRSGSTVSFTFVSALDASDITTLTGLVGSHDPIDPIAEQNAKLIVADDHLRVIRGAKQLIYYGGKTHVIKVDVEGQGDYTDLTTAVLENYAPGNAFILYPGTYPVMNPLTLPEKTIIKSAVGDPANTLIVPANPNAAIIVLDKQSAIDKVTIAGAAGPSGIGIKYDGNLSSPGLYSRLQGVQVIDCYTGIDISGANNQMFIFETGVMAATQVCGVGMNVHSGGYTGGDTVLFSGNPFNKMHVGICVEGNGSLALFGNSLVGHCVDCTVIRLGGDLNLSFASIQDSTRGIVVVSNDGENDFPETTAKMNNVTIRNMLGNHVDITGKYGEISLPGSKLQEERISNPDGARITGSPIFSEEDGRFHASFIGELRVGNQYTPTKFSTGEGLPTISGNIVLSNDNLEVGTWVDNTEASLSRETPAFDLFQGLTAGNCAYIGSDTSLYGIKLRTEANYMTDADNANLVWEYWNGSAWEQINIMVTSASAPYYSRTTSMSTVAGVEYVELNVDSSSTQTLKSLNGISRYWIRIRVIDTLINNPNIQKLKTCHSHTTFHKDGYTQLFGDSRCVKTLDWKMVTDPVLAPDDDSFYLSKSLVLKGTNCLYPASVLRRRTMVACIPADINTAWPIKISWRFVVRGVAAVGTVRWIVKWGKSNEGTTVYSDEASAPATVPSESSITKDTNILFGDSNKMIDESVEINVNTFNFRPENGEHDILWLTLERDGADAADTYMGGVSFFRMCEVKYVKFSHEHHLLSF